MQRILDVKQILVINLGGLGDLVLSTPALRALRRLYPKAYIALLTLSRCGVLAKGLTYIDDVLICRGLKDIFNLRKNRFDIAINMRTLASAWGTIKMAILFSLSGARYKVGRDTQGRGFFLHLKIPETDIATMHDINYNLSLMGLLGADTQDKRIELNISTEDNLYVEQFFVQNQLKKSDILVGINPAATWQSKRWPLENFARVINGLLQRRDCKIVVTGSKEDIPLAKRLKDLTRPELIIAAGKTSTGEFLALLNRFNLFITNDGGPMHIAWILKKPFIAIFGPTDLVRFGPYQRYQNGIVLCKKMDCSPCFKKRCRSLKCLKAISPEEVLATAMRLLEVSG